MSRASVRFGIATYYRATFRNVIRPGPCASLTVPPAHEVHPGAFGPKRARCTWSHSAPPFSDWPDCCFEVRYLCSLSMTQRPMRLLAVQHGDLPARY